VPLAYIKNVAILHIVCAWVESVRSYVVES
jgi:hypothetical protein